VAVPRHVLGVVVAVVLLVVAVASLIAASNQGQDPRDRAALRPSPSGSTSSTPEAPPGPPLLLPNLRSVAATELGIQRVAGGGRRLRFAASLANLGLGPLLLRPHPSDERCRRTQHPAVQVLLRDRGADGVYRPGRDRRLRSRFAGCMLVHPGHDHWHFDAMASYVLRVPGSGRVVAARHKVSFCLRDNRRAGGVATRVRREHFGECSRTTRQGISPGWVDVYSADLPGQSLHVPPGEGRRAYCLELTADPRDRVTETDESDNATATGVVIRGDRAALAPGLDC